MVSHHSSGKVNKAGSTHYMVVAFPEDKWEAVLPFTTLKYYYISNSSVPLCYAFFYSPTICETFGKLVFVCVSVIARVKLDDNFTS